MENRLAENIGRLRKEKKMTQERMAEALGVSYAAVSKWERGAAVPELRLIMEMADLFEVSVDALIGYVSGSESRDKILAELRNSDACRSGRKVSDTVEKALRRYPDDFEIVYHGAEYYAVHATCTGDRHSAQRAIDLFRHALYLIRQNTDPEISETGIWIKVSDLYILLGEKEKGVEILGKNNPCGLNDARIGQTLAADCDDPDRAMPYLSRAVLSSAVVHMQTVVGFLNVYFSRKEYQKADAVLAWGISFYEGLHRDDSPGCMDKGEAVLWAIRAETKLRLNCSEESEECLKKAAEISKRFDAAPNYRADSLQFVEKDTRGFSFDDIGETAADGVEKVISDLDDPELMKMWRNI